MQGAVSQGRNESQGSTPQWFQQEAQGGGALEEFKRDIETLAGYFEGGGTSIFDDVPTMTEELTRKLEGHFLGDGELSIQDYRELYRTMAFAYKGRGRHAVPRAIGLGIKMLFCSNGAKNRKKCDNLSFFYYFCSHR